MDLTAENVQRFVQDIGRVNDFVDYFAGSRRIHSTLTKCGWKGCFYDIQEQRKYMDMSIDVGQAVALILMLSVVAQGLICGGPECSTWIVMSMGHTKRNTQIEGDVSRSDVRRANACSRFLAVLTQLAELRHVYWWWEQPNGSVFFETAWWKQMQEQLGRGAPIFFWMQSWGHYVPKPSKVLGSLPGLDRLRKTKPMPAQRAGAPAPSIVKHSKDKRWWSGTKQTKATQVYPWDFCAAIANTFSEVHVWEGAPGLSAEWAVAMGMSAEHFKNMGLDRASAPKEQCPLEFEDDYQRMAYRCPQVRRPRRSRMPAGSRANRPRRSHRASQVQSTCAARALQTTTARWPDSRA